MPWLKPNEQRSNPLEDPTNPLAKMFMFMGGEKTVTGRSMNDGKALSLPAFFNGVAIISGDLATIPLKVYSRTTTGGRQEETGHPLSGILGLSPSPMLSSAAWREAAQGHRLLRGNSYSEIISTGRGVVRSIRLHSPDDIQQVAGTEFYKVISEQRMVHAGDMLHVPGPGGDGVNGWSVIKLARENLALASALEESNARFIANASRPSGFLTSPTPLSSEALDRLKGQFGSRTGGLDNVGKTPVVDSGITWQQVGLSAEDTQYIESRDFSVLDVARWLNIPPHKIKDLSRATFTNVEEMSIDYVRGTLRPWAVRDEQAMNIKLLTARERASGLFIAYNLDGLLRGDIATRTEAYRSRIETGQLTPNEARALENMDSRPGGDDTFMRLDMAPVVKLADIQNSTSGSDARVSHRAEYRTHDNRIGLRSSFAPLILEAAGRMVRGEVRNIRRIVSRTEEPDLRSRIETYYFNEHPTFASGVMGSVFRSYAESVAVAAATEVDSDVRIDSVTYADTYTDAFAARYSARSRRALNDLNAEQIEQRLTVWTEGDEAQAPRPDAIASQEAVKLGDAVARSAFIAAGVVQLVWRTIGDSCPYCVRLNGTVIGSRQSFLQSGVAFEGEGTDVPLIPKHKVSHAPAHRGCNCTIGPA